MSDEQSSASRGWVIAAAIGIGAMLLGTVALFVWALLFQAPNEQTFHRPQVLIGECSLSGSGEIRIVVT